MKEIPVIKSTRILRIYFELTKGKTLSKKDLAEQFHVTERSIQRDLEMLRCFLADQDTGQELIYDRGCHAYYILSASSNELSNSEVLAVCKILLESRSMRRDELFPVLDKLVDCCVPEQNKKAVKKLIAKKNIIILSRITGNRF